MLSFDDYCIDLQQSALLHGDSQIPLRPKSFDVLRYLVERTGRLVSREELTQAVWPGIFVSDDSLVQCVGDIREALHDHDHRIVKTVAKRGYVLTPDVFGRAADKSVPKPGARGQEITFCRTSDGVNIALARTMSWMPVTA
jgi:DNA-binding winged helix-turn-helix (wHTH) protein